MFLRPPNGQSYKLAFGGGYWYRGLHREAIFEHFFHFDLVYYSQRHRPHVFMILSSIYVIWSITTMDWLIWKAKEWGMRSQCHILCHFILFYKNHTSTWRRFLSEPYKVVEIFSQRGSLTEQKFFFPGILKENNESSKLWFLKINKIYLIDY